MQLQNDGYSSIGVSKYGRYRPTPCAAKNQNQIAALQSKEQKEKIRLKLFAEQEALSGPSGLFFWGGG